MERHYNGTLHLCSQIYFYSLKIILPALDSLYARIQYTQCLRPFDTSYYQNTEVPLSRHFGSECVYFLITRPVID